MTTDHPCRVALISDLHFAPGGAACGGRRGEIGDVLLLRTVHRLNRFIKPDVVLVLGDLIDDPEAAGSLDLLRVLKRTLDLLDAPTLVIPGNHDPHPDRFYEVFDRVEQLDVAGVRFVAFLDPEEPGWNARRTSESLARTRRARGDHTGPLVAVQHVPATAPGVNDCPFGYTNADDVAAAMRAAGFSLSVSGHFHPGDLPADRGGISFAAVPALCEEPFAFAVLDVGGGPDAYTVHAHQLPSEAELFDYHTHTPFAYCYENVEMTRSIVVAEAVGLAGLAFAEHSGQLYYDRDAYWSGAYMVGIRSDAQGYDPRADAYWDCVNAYRSESVLAGLEADVTHAGELLLGPGDREQAQVLLGSIHRLTETQDVAAMEEEFLRQVGCLAQTGIDILAHPFRIFRRGGVAVDEALYAPTVELLRRHRVAAEINFHTNDPAPEFVRLCLEAGVQLAFGSDAHNLYEVGEFHPHLDLLARAGFTGNPRDVLLQPSHLRR